MTARSSESQISSRHSAASIPVYFVELDPGVSVETAPVHNSALMDFLAAVILVLTRTSAYNAQTGLASAKPRLITGSSERGWDMLSWSWECHHRGAWCC